MSRDKQNIKTTDWLTRGMTEAELAKEKEEAIKEAEAELCDKQIEERIAHMMYEQAEKSGHAMSSITKVDILIAQAKREVAEEIFAEIENINAYGDGYYEYWKDWLAKLAELKKKYTESEKD